MTPEAHKTGIRVLKFWTTYTPDQNNPGQMRAVDMVAYCPKGEANLTVSMDAVARLAKVRPYEPGSEDMAAWLANQRWDYIRPQYEAWKKGHSMPEAGTPIGAWPGISPEQAEALRTAGFRSVEEVAEMTDGQMSRVPLPGTRRLKETAQAFLAAADKTAVSSALAKKDEELAAMRAELEEMKQLMLESMREDAPKKRNGRHAKVEAEAEAA